MKLITEEIQELEVIAEADSRFSETKNLYIKGIFLQGNIVNKNRRMYPMDILDKEVSKYNEEFTTKNRAYGELGHPDGPKINADRISHRIVELIKSGNDYHGKAIIIPEGMGKIVTGIINTGGTLAASSRALGSLKQASEGYNIVQEDFKLATAADIVIDPSAPSAFVNGIYESAEYLFDEKLGMRVVNLAEVTQTKLKKMTVKQINEQAVSMFTKYLDTLSVEIKKQRFNK